MIDYTRLEGATKIAAAPDIINQNMELINGSLDFLNDNKANQTTTYTKTEVDSIASDKVSKSGDTFAGGTVSFFRGSTNGFVEFGGGTEQGTGGTLIACGEEWSANNNNSAAILRAKNSKGQTAEIKVTPTGTYAPTPATTDNSTKIATTAWVNSYALAKSGGTMNGTLSFTSVAPRLVKTDNTGFLGIYGGASYADGGYVVAFGKNYPNYAGAVQLCANDGVNESQFWLHPNKNQGSDFVIEHKYDGTDGRWYRKWNSGFIEQGGLKPQGSNYTVTFLLAFPNVCKSLTFSPVWSGDDYAFSINLKTLTKTNFTVNQKSATSGAFGSSTIQFYWYACGY